MSTTIAVLALVMAYVALVAAYLALRTLARLRRSTAALGRGADGRETVVEAAERHIKVTRDVAAELERVRVELALARDATADDLQAGQSVISRALRKFDDDAARALRNVALVRYDAFDDMSGRLSFSLALLDDRGDGVTLSSIAGHNDTRVYAKGIQAGSGDRELSPEELQAIDAALRRPSAERRKAG